MSSKEHESVRAKMDSLRLICDKEISSQQQKIDTFASSFRKKLESVSDVAKETAQLQVKLDELKSKLRDSEDEWVKALAVKTRKEAKRIALVDAINAQRARNEELRGSLQEQTVKRDQYAATISQESLALAEYEGKANESIERTKETQEAISWYNRVLGFHVEGGHGVKFTFKNINSKNSKEEYFFTIRHENDTYKLLNCEPSLKDSKELIQDLNKTNGLFKFVRVMRKKFQEASAQDSLALIASDHQESGFISASAPVLSLSSARSDSPTKENTENRQYKKQNLRRGVKPGVLSPGSASSVRQSPRLKVRKQG